MKALSYAHKVGRAPVVPPQILERHAVMEASDSRFRSAARLRQALLRQERGWPIGSYRTSSGKRRKLGNYIAPSAAEAAAFISPEIMNLVRREVAYREEGALVDQKRLWQNMLSSAPLVFNLFGALKLDLSFATRVLQLICPDIIHRVTDVVFEHSPGRRDPRFLGDRTAFDVLVKCVTRQRQHGFIAFEIKYSEDMTEPAARVRPRYGELILESGLYRDPNDPALLAAPLQQFVRQHLLASCAVKNGLYSQGRFVVIAPALNTAAQNAIQQYRQHLTDSRAVQFDAVTLESIIRAIRSVGARDLAAALHERYCDFSAIDRIITPNT
jgi:hypothetical protein